MPDVPLYKEQGVVLRSVKLGEADKIVTVMTQGSGKVRAVAKGIRKTTSRFGARLEPFTHVSLMVYRGRGALDTVSQAEILSPFSALRGDLGSFAAGETMLEAVDKVAEAGEAYYVGPGHTGEVGLPGTEVIEFSPTSEYNETMAVMAKNLEAAFGGE